MISHELKCIYVHIPKTAGTSVEKSLGGHKDMNMRLKQDHRSVNNIIGAIPPWQREEMGLRSWLVYFNQHYRAYQDGVEVLNQSQFAEYFKFCFVRNPWERAYSWYRNVMRDEMHQHELSIAANTSFKAFLLEHGEQWALRPQMDWITDNSGKVAVDFVGKFERLEKDFSYVCQQLGLQNISLPMTLDSGKSPYIDAYDTELETWVAQRYADEISAFNYSFGQ